jgi:cytochrome c peroxidase
MTNLFRKGWIYLFFCVALVLLCFSRFAPPLFRIEAVSSLGRAPLNWEPSELEVLQSLSLSALPPTPRSPGNLFADSSVAAALGKRLFFDKNLSVNGQVSCASCHLPEKFFTDGKVKSQGLGEGFRNTPTLLSVAYGLFLKWDGSKDSVWAQSLAPLVHPAEHGMTREKVVHYIMNTYQKEFEELTKDRPNLKNSNLEKRLFAAVGKVIEAYLRTLVMLPSRFDDYVEQVVSKQKQKASKQRVSLSLAEERGLKLFLGKGACINCHNGPLFTDQHFHNTGIPSAEPEFHSEGQWYGAQVVIKDEFNCLGKHSDASAEDCKELRFLRQDIAPQMGAFKTPTLRNSTRTAPYMHAGQLLDLPAVLEHYNRAPGGGVGSSELFALDLTEFEKNDLISFLASLESSWTEKKY